MDDDDQGPDPDRFDAGDAAAVAGHRLRAGRAETRRLAALTALMGGPDGRRYVWWLLDRCGVFRTSFTGDTATYFNEGMRNVGLMLMGDINAACPEQYLVMINEAKEDDHV